MKDEKGYTEKWIDLLSKLLTIAVTFYGGLFLYWTTVFLKEEVLSEKAIYLAILEITTNMIVLMAIMVLLVKKIKIFGRLEK